MILMQLTQSFNEMNTVQQLDWLSDMLGEACFAVADCTGYQSMTNEQKEQVKENFYTYLKNENVEITNEVIDAAEREFSTSPLPYLIRFYKYYTKGEFSQATEQLQEGRKVTIVKFSEFGFPVVINTVIDSVTVEPYAQYRESLKIIHKPKRKRSLYGLRVLPKESMLVYDGWLDIDLDSFSNNILRQNEFVTVKQSKYRSFDKQFMKDALATIKDELIVRINIK